MEPRTFRTPTSAAERLTEVLLVLGTALTIYWQPVSQRIALKPSDGVFLVAIGVWVLLAIRATRVPKTADIVFIPFLLASIVLATAIGYAQNHLGMSRNGVILFGRLVVCITLFLAVYSLVCRHPPFRRWVALAFLSPLVLFPGMLLPAVSTRMWDKIGRLQGLTLNANTAAVAFLIAFALAYTLAAYEAGMKRRLRAAAFFAVAVAMLALILSTQSRAYFPAAFASAILGTALAAAHCRLPTLKLVLVATGSFVLVVAGIFLLEPGQFAVSQLIRLSPVTRTFDAPTDPQKVQSSRPRWTMTRFQQFVEGGVQKIEGDTRMSAIHYYAQVLSTNLLGLGLNYETKFTVKDPETGIRHGPNTILDLPVYGGVGAVLSVAYLALLVGRRTKRNLALAVDENVPYTIGAVAALGGLWGAAVLVGSPLFDYQFWILTAIALA